MLSWLLPVACFLSASVFLLLGLRLLGRLRWLVAWMQGTIAILCIVVAMIVGILGLDLLNYREASYDQLIANLSFQQIDEQRFEARLVDLSGQETHYAVAGDQWQLDARVFQWAKGIPAKPLYRMERLSGRYLALEQEYGLPKSEYTIRSSDTYLDAWTSIRRHAVFFPFINAIYASARFLPMADGAIYSISMGPHGLIGRPLNEAAIAALREWH